MPYKITKRDCTQSDGDDGDFVLSYTDDKGKNHKACNTSKKNAQDQIKAIEIRRESVIRDLVRCILDEGTH